MSPDTRIRARAEALYESDRDAIHRRTDRWFAALMALQWPFAVGLALWISPQAWAGSRATVHSHGWAAVVLGGLITVPPILLALLRPGRAATRHLIAVAPWPRDVRGALTAFGLECSRLERDRQIVDRSLVILSISSGS